MRKRLFIFLATWMTACTAAAPSVTGPGAAGKADGVDTNTSETLASLTVQAPSAGDAQLTFRRSPMPLGQAVMLAPGGGCLSISSSFFRVPFDVSCNLMLDSAKPTTVALATLRTSWDRTSVTTDFGAAAAVESVSLDGRTVATRAPDGALVPPGHYGFSFNYGVLGEVQATVTAGADQTADLTVPDVRATVTLVPPSRLYPDPTPTDCEEPARHALVRRRGDPPPGINEPALHLGGIFERTTSTTAVEYRLFDLLSKTSFRILPLTTREKPDRYELVVNNMVEPLALTPGASLEIDLDRIDVNDVTVTGSDGSKQSVAGTYEIYRDVSGGWEKLALVGGDWWDGQGCGQVVVGRSSFPTKTGLDVLPGRYKVVVTWSSPLGTQTTEHILNLK